jgi:hypothetical protein
VIFVGGVGRGRGRQHLPRTLADTMRSQLATLVRGSSVTAHCLAATALLIREYQGDHRRQDLISAASHATDPLTSPSISVSCAREHAWSDRNLKEALELRESLSASSRLHV